MHENKEVQRSRLLGRLTLRPKVSYLPNRKAYEIQTPYTDGARRPVSPTSNMTSKVKAQGRKVTWCVWHVLAHKSRTKSPRNTKIGRKVACPLHGPTGNKVHQFKVKRWKVNVTRQISAVADATWLMWNRSTDSTAVGEYLSATQLVLIYTVSEKSSPLQLLSVTTLILTAILILILTLILILNFGL